MMGPGMRWIGTALVLTTACTAGCLVSPDENLWRLKVQETGVNPHDLRVVDAGPKDGPKDGPAVDASSCSALGLSATCDPLTTSGCSKGSCYIVLNKGSACVCPTGTIATGGACFTTVECAPGNVCAAPQPGTCRATCARKDASTCPGGQSCQKINGLPAWGFCK
jgi:hypothetical protein